MGEKTYSLWCCGIYYKLQINGSFIILIIHWRQVSFMRGLGHFVLLINMTSFCFHQQPEKTIQCLKKEDPDQRLVNHLSKHDVWSCLPLVDWFRRCFSNVLPDTSFERSHKWKLVQCQHQPFSSNTMGKWYIMIMKFRLQSWMI